ncbi:MAG: BamA/TamA family outer membrane protein [Planctomycetes bacterium]|nr:BamA/TamA family outer membrane protein [Planctomycetota bacterium]
MLARLLALCLCFALLGFIPPRDEGVVASIDVAGNRRVATAQILENMRTRVGKLIDPNDVQQDIRDLYARFGIRVTVETEKHDGAVRLFLKVDEEAMITDVVVDGVADERARELLEDVSLFGVHTMLEAQVRDRATELEQRLKDEGRYYARVEITIEPSSDGMTARLKVHEGEKIAIDDVVFSGSSLPADRLLGVMTTKPTRLVVFKSYLRQDQLDRDLVELERHLGNEGFRSAKATLAGVDVDEDGDSAVVRIAIEEGSRYSVSSVVVQGDGSVPQEALDALIETKAGDPLRAAVLERDRDALKNAMQERGFIRAEVETSLEYAETTNEARVVHRVSPGTMKRVRDVVVRGNTQTPDGIVRREVTLRPGDLADGRELKKTADRLRATGWFRDDRGRDLVDVRFRETSDPLLEDVLVDVEEVRSGRLFFVAGADTDIGFFAGVNLEKNNFDLHDTPSAWDPITLFSEFWSNEAFHGGGQRLQIQVQPGSRVSTARLTFEDPYFRGSERDPLALRFDVYAVQSQIFDEFDEDRYGVSTTFTRRLDEHWTAGVIGRFDLVNIGDLDDAPDDVEDVDGLSVVPAVGLLAKYQDFDSVLMPSKGYEVGGRYELLTLDAWGQRAVAAGSWLTPLYEDDRGRKHLFNVRGAVGAAQGFSGELPFFERLQGGGSSGDFPLRGFELRGIGPEDEDVHLGGAFAYSTSFEYAFPLYSTYEALVDQEIEYVRGVAFVDIGSVEDSVAGLFGKPRASIGAGVRVRLPFLGDAPVSVDLGVPLLEEKDDSTELISVRVSTRF